MKRIRFSLALLLLLSISISSAYPHSGGLDSQGGHYNRKTGEYHFHRQELKPLPKPPNIQQIRKVARAVDGDTLVLDGKERVRLIGVDTPETVHPTKPVEFFGKEASRFTKREIEGKKVESNAQIKQQETQQKEQDSERDFTIKKYEIDTEAQVRLLLQKIDSGETVNLEEIKRTLKDEPITRETERITSVGNSVQRLADSTNKAIEGIVGQLGELRDMASAPREVVRDDKGRVVGVRSNGKTQKIKRDNGKVTGIE